MIYISQVSNSQAAYQTGRSTIGRVLTFKLRAEKAISSGNYTIHILMMEISKAFDTINRDTVMTELVEMVARARPAVPQQRTVASVIEMDELNMVKMLMKDVKLIVKVDNTFSDTFNTNMGVPQGDFFSPTIFIWYLARNLNRQPRQQETDHVYNKASPSQEELPPQPHIQGHTY